MYLAAQKLATTPQPIPAPPHGEYLLITSYSAMKTQLENVELMQAMALAERPNRSLSRGLSLVLCLFRG